MKRKMPFYNLLQLLLVVVCSYGRCDGQIISTFAGNGTSGITSGDGGQATAAGIDGPGNGAFDKYGNYYFATIGSHCIRKIDGSGIITTIAGTIGVLGFSGDGGPATAAKFNQPCSVALDTARNLYVTDASNNRIRRINLLTGIITTVVGTGTTAGFSGDGGPATAAMLNLPQHVCLDKDGNLYVSDYGNIRIRKVNTSGIISTFAGTGAIGVSSNGALADTSKVGGLAGITTDNFGNLFFADVTFGKVFKINSGGGISCVAGSSGGYLYNGDNVPATTAYIDPYDLAVDDFNNIFIADKHNNRLRNVDAFGIIHTIAGSGTAGFVGDGGMAATAELYSPVGVTLDSCGNIYIAEANNNRIRKVTYPHCNYLSVPQVERQVETVVFPNPVATELNINTTAAIESVVITNMIGQVVYSGKEKSFDVAYLKPGMYFVMVNNEFSAKFVKE